MTKTLEPGDKVRYEDMANPPREYEVVSLPNTVHKFDYTLRDLETGETKYSDCRQRGWTVSR